MWTLPTRRLFLTVLLGASQAGGAPQATSTFQHVFMLVLENRSYAEVIGNLELPTINALAKAGGLARNYTGVAHPSLPNYVAMIAGSTMNMHGDDPSQSFRGATLASQLESRGLSWRAYMQGLPKVGSNAPYAGLYGKKHNPFMLSADIAQTPKRAQNVVPFEQLGRDLAANQVPNFSMLVPDLCHDLHGDLRCLSRSNVNRLGDAFVKQWTTAIMQSKAWVPGSALIITFDEGEDARGGGGVVPTIILTPGGKAGLTSDRAYNHYSLLRTLEDGFGLPPLRGAIKAQPMSDLLP
jgi:phosphatidylinositol-3-phosphatase